MARQEDRTAAREVAARILSLRKERETDADFARRLGISPQLLHYYKKGGGASIDVVAQIARTEQRAYWLLTGDNPPAQEGGELERVEGMELDRLHEFLSALLDRIHGDAERIQAEASTAIQWLRAPRKAERPPLTDEQMVMAEWASELPGPDARTQPQRKAAGE